MKFNVRRVTDRPKHHLFGFHDLVQSNARGDLILSLEVEDISRPPMPGETCASGVVRDGAFIKIHDTHTWNYPQGARQQWIGDTDLFACNDREPDGRLVCRVSDARKGVVCETLPFPVHCLDANSGKAIYINYDRVHAVGGYGYTPLVAGNGNRLEDIPSDDGLWIGNLRSKSNGELLVSLAQIAVCGEKRPVRTGFPHYITHPMLSPDGKRVAFLHRYRLMDGGETTRLLTIGVDGHNLRLLGKGFLSHFTWISNDEIFIWGKNDPSLYAMREARWLRIPGAQQGVVLAKKLVKTLRGVRRSSGSGVAQANFFLKIKDSEDVSSDSLGGGILVEDGHPMANPRNLHYLVNDTYPDADGNRWLMFYDVDKNERTNVGQFRRLFEVPDIAHFNWRATQAGMDPRIVKKFNRDDYLFYRSGFHCDLHPRWSADGEVAYFDSIHEGTRQIYAVEKI